MSISGLVLPFNDALAELRANMGTLEDQDYDLEEMLDILIDTVVNRNPRPLLDEFVEHYVAKHLTHERGLARQWIEQFTAHVYQYVEALRLRDQTGQFPFYTNESRSGLIFMLRNPYDG